jgi:4-amino-4-deoxy-L-arabinose transferase-like glycosyltransferase
MRIRVTPLAIVMIGTLLRLILAVAVPLFPDETYYWEWSRHLAAGYFDHPPAIAVLIRAGTALFGDTPLGVRAGSIVAGGIASWALVVLARRLYDHGAGHASDGGEQRAALLMACIPIALVGFVLATPDAPLLAAVAVMLVALDRAFAAPVGSAEALRWWCAAGVMLGVGLCAKYTAVLIPFGVLCAMLVHPTLRARFREPGPYVATLVAIVVFSPVIHWNADHDWISFVFQVRHGLGTPKGSAFTREANLLGGQLGLISPIIAVMAGIAIVQALRRPADDRRFALAAIATVIIAFFAISALRKPVEANWPAPAFLAALPLLATWHIVGRARQWFTWGGVLAAGCTVVISVHAFNEILPIAPRRDPIAKAYGWDQVAAQVEQVRDTIVSNTSCRHAWVAADRYQDASELAFHMREHPTVFALNLGGRANQYDLWPGVQTVARPEDCLVLLVDDNTNGMTVVQRAAEWHGRPHDGGLAILSRGQRPIDRRRIWILRDGVSGKQ